MLGLVAVLWAVYLSECLVRWKPGQWVFRRTLSGAIEGVHAPDVTFWNERLAFVWTSPWPALPVYRFSGRDANVRDFSERLALHGRASRWLRASAAVLFLLLLVIFPVLALTEQLLPWVLPLGGAILVAWISTFTAFVRTWRRVTGTKPSLESWLTHALSPVSLARAPQVVSVDLSPETHPVVAADRLCDGEEFLRIARLWHFDDPALREKIERLAEKRELKERLLAAPAAVEAGVTRFCRRCHATFKDAADVCVDCRTVALAPLPRRA